MKENGIYIGNLTNKYESKNLLIRLVVNHFKKDLYQLINLVNPQSIHEVGCGEGYWTLQLNNKNFKTRGSDFSQQIISIAAQNAKKMNFDENIFKVKSIYDLSHDDSAELILCCEVLEHLEHPERALEKLQKIVTGHIILSVPREPLWRILNVVRGKYLSSTGNTPGHLQHWSKRSFIKFISNYFEIIEIKTPLPWIMLLCRAKHSNDSHIHP